MLQVPVRKQYQEAAKLHSGGVGTPVRHGQAKAKPCPGVCKGPWMSRCVGHGKPGSQRAGEKRGRTAAEQNRSGEVRRGGRGGRHGQSGDCNHLRRSLAPPATGAAAGAHARPKRGRMSPGAPRSGVPDPREPQGGRAEGTRRLSSHLSRVGVPISRSHRHR